jgi:hypothetical protein
MKSFATHAAAYIAGFVTLFALMLVFGDYEETPAPIAVAQEVAPTPTTVPTGTPASTQTPTQTPTATPAPPTPTPLPTWTPQPPSMNTDIMVDNIRWKALSVSDIGNTLTSDNQFIDDVSTAGHFVKVVIEVENRGSEPINYDAPDLLDLQNRRYNAYSERFFFLSESEACSLLTLNPNLARQCAEIYEVAPDASGYQLITTNLNWLDIAESPIALR